MESSELESCDDYRRHMLEDASPEEYGRHTVEYVQQEPSPEEEEEVIIMCSEEEEVIISSKQTEIEQPEQPQHPVHIIEKNQYINNIKMNYVPYNLQNEPMNPYLSHSQMHENNNQMNIYSYHDQINLDQQFDEAENDETKYPKYNQLNPQKQTIKRNKSKKSEKLKSSDPNKSGSSKDSNGSPPSGNSGGSKEKSSGNNSGSGGSGGSRSGRRSGSGSGRRSGGTSNSGHTSGHTSAITTNSSITSAGSTSTSHRSNRHNSLYSSYVITPSPPYPSAPAMNTKQQHSEPTDSTQNSLRPNSMKNYTRNYQNDDEEEESQHIIECTAVPPHGAVDADGTPQRNVNIVHEANHINADMIPGWFRVSEFNCLSDARFADISDDDTGDDKLDDPDTATDDEYNDDEDYDDDDNISLESLIDFYRKERKFVDIHRPNRYKQDNNATQNKRPKIRVLSWNILADGKKYALSTRHQYCPRKYRDWNYRAKRIKAQILAFDADIICLQETTYTMYQDFVVPEFPQYTTIHAKLDDPTSQSDTLLFRTSRFKCIKHAIFRLGILPANDDILGLAPNMFRTFLRRTTDHMIVAILADTQNNTEFVATTSHIFWDPLRPQTKAAQSWLLLQNLINLLTTDSSWELSSIPQKVYQQQTEQEIINAVPIIFACDSNSVPCKTSAFGPKMYTKSAHLELMHNNKLAMNHTDHPFTQFRLRMLRAMEPSLFPGGYNATISAQQIHALKMIKKWNVSCDFKWKSVYNEYGKQEYCCSASAKSRQHEHGQNDIYNPPFTNKTPFFCENIDYLWYSAPFQVTAVLELPYNHCDDDMQDVGNDDDKNPYIDSKQKLKNQFKAFQQLIKRYRYHIGYIKSMRQRKKQQLVFHGYCHQYCSSYWSIQEVPDTVTAVFLSYYLPKDNEYDMVLCEEQYRSTQTWWRMLYALYPDLIDPVMELEDDELFEFYRTNRRFRVALKTVNYPDMPNKKDPSDHFLLCCDLEITT